MAIEVAIAHKVVERVAVILNGGIGTVVIRSVVPVGLDNLVYPVKLNSGGIVIILHKRVGELVGVVPGELIRATGG